MPFAKGAPGEPPAFTGEIALLTDTMPENTVLANQLKASDEEIKSRVSLENAKTVAAKELGRGDEHYVGDIMCARCHQGLVEHWGTTPHAAAFKLLEDKHEEKNPECISCHVTGFGRESGFEDAHSSPDLSNVQCEACHGTGTSHGPGYAAAARSSCATCHTPKWSPNFDYKTAWKKIAHPRDTAALSAGARG